MKPIAASILALLLHSMLFSAPAVAGDAEVGAKLFKRLCSGCHNIGPSVRSSFGPELNGIIDRPAGSAQDYQYSTAMKSSGIVWTRDKLTQYLQDPKGVVPGTRMIFWGLSDEEKIDNLLAYLQTFPNP
ncbi:MULTISPECIES: cytochrome c family protein [Pseudomonas]|uniref:Cytochrome c family protein n=2 Tax=Pseudomonas chlororaphis group TaxID=136842 RepID=A0ABY9NIY5_9PSED|nr:MULTISPECIES: cytochrome c family protein [Pseudomonas]AZC22028.1 Cytochrome c [Pseudomonas sessilinigenes]QIH05646.1 cytochrome c family protein [Pseudomonas sp. BIOMIG1BAC]QXH41125.1 cytochrome c family protein [Pseudomonas sessilinigenes]UMZ12443.1 cytochrome c family protein [Pseudomonas sp. MPFS]WMN18132.1 cytochrome c family protein [Pseudomonas piscis]